MFVVSGAVPKQEWAGTGALVEAIRAGVILIVWSHWSSMQSIEDALKVGIFT